MLIPIRTDRQLRLRPRVTAGLIMVNMLVYLAGLVIGAAGDSAESVIRHGVLVSGEGFRPLALITYQFLHDPSSIFHLLFNMVFLWVFGSAVEDRMGHRLFLLFYLTGGVCAGLAHMMVSPGVGVIGASGATAAVTGAFLALYPRGRVLVLFIFILIGIHAIRAPWLVAIYFGIDFFSQMAEFAGSSRRNVAYAAHLAGYAFGVSVPLALLQMRVLKRDPEDGAALLRQWKRRREFRRLQRSGSERAATPVAIDTPAPEAPHAAPSPEEVSAQRRRTETARDRITSLLAAGDRARAEALWREHRAADGDFLLPAALQHELATALFASGCDTDAQMACEDYLKKYGDEPGSDEMRLLLAVVHGRRLGDRAQGTALAREVAGRRKDDDLGRLAAELEREFSPS